MCGVACAIEFRRGGGRRRDIRARNDEILRAMAHRGPDGRGVHHESFADRDVSLFHTRLAIIDLDPRSNQPFRLDRCTMVFNGEIYNYRELRSELIERGHSFRTDSDTEVLLRLFLEDGVSGFARCEGMWAAIILDSDSGTVWIARDRFGEKPIWIHEAPDGALFLASEVSILESMIGTALELDDRFLVRYLTEGHRTLFQRDSESGKLSWFFKGVSMIEPGTVTTVDRSGVRNSKPFWNPLEVSVDDTSADRSGEVLERLTRAVSLRLRADVPIAFCLSGGIDSSSILSLAVRELAERGSPLQSFSVIDSDPRYNERSQIEELVRITGAASTYIELDAGNVTHADRFSHLVALIKHRRAPLSTISYYVHSLLSQAIGRAGITVALSGTGADELFTGYYDHFLYHLAALPEGDILKARRAAWDEWIKPIVRNPLLRDPDLFRRTPLEHRHLFPDRSFLNSIVRHPGELQYRRQCFPGDILRARMLDELFTEIVPVILYEDDMNSMMYGIENRSPFLDTGLYRLTRALPTAELIDNGYAKWTLRNAMRGILPDKIRLQRAKVGFNASVRTLFPGGAPELLSLLNASPFLKDLLDTQQVELLLQRNDQSFSDSMNRAVFNLMNLIVFVAVREGRV